MSTVFIKRREYACYLVREAIAYSKKAILLQILCCRVGSLWGLRQGLCGHVSEPDLVPLPLCPAPAGCPGSRSLWDCLAGDLAAMCLQPLVELRYCRLPFGGFLIWKWTWFCMRYVCFSPVGTVVQNVVKVLFHSTSHKEQSVLWAQLATSCLSGYHLPSLKSVLLPQ